MKKYNSDFKLEVVKFYEKNGFRKTLRVYNISNTALQKWMRNYKEGTFMRKPTKKYTLEDKLEIINYYRINGSTATVKEYNISKSVFQKWERILIEEGETALGIERRGRAGKQRQTKKVDEDEDLLKEVQRLRLENAYLKKLNALDQEKQKKKLK